MCESCGKWEAVSCGLCGICITNGEGPGNEEGE